MIKPYLSSIINDYKTQGEWKIYLIMTNNFFIKRDQRTCWLAQIQRNWLNFLAFSKTAKWEEFFDLLKVGKITSNFLTCSKSAKGPEILRFSRI